MFDKEWLESLIELQKKSRELAEGVAWPKEYLDAVMQAIQNSSKNPASFGMPDYSREFKGLWNVGTQFVYEDSHEPKISITETAKAFLIKAAIPGLQDKRDICVKVHGNVVNISGKTPDNSGKQDKKPLMSFNKSIPLPAGVDPEKSTAKYWDGILTLYLPKSPKTDLQHIEVSFS